MGITSAVMFSFWGNKWILTLIYLLTWILFLLEWWDIKFLPSISLIFMSIICIWFTYVCFWIKLRHSSYSPHVRPILEYGSEIWNPSTKGLITAIERVQRRATRFILQSSAPYEERLKELNLSSLEDRRKFKDNILLFKGLHGMSFIPLHDRVNFCGTESISLRSTDSPTIIPNKCNTNIFKQTFFKVGVNHGIFHVYHFWNFLIFKCTWVCSSSSSKNKNIFLNLSINSINLKMSIYLSISKMCSSLFRGEIKLARV